jgi:hypothetical protein
MSRDRALEAGLIALLVAAAGCKKPGTWSCNNETTHACSEWSGATSETKKQGCARMGGIFASEPCPTANAVGICKSGASEPGGDSRIVFFAPRTVEDAAKACARAGGSWSVP